MPRARGPLLRPPPSRGEQLAHARAHARARPAARRLRGRQEVLGRDVLGAAFAEVREDVEVQIPSPEQQGVRARLAVVLARGRSATVGNITPQTAPKVTALDASGSRPAPASERGGPAPRAPARPQTHDRPAGRGLPRRRRAGRPWRPRGPSIARIYDGVAELVPSRRLRRGDQNVTAQDLAPAAVTRSRRPARLLVVLGPRLPLSTREPAPVLGLERERRVRHLPPPFPELRRVKPGSCSEPAIGISLLHHRARSGPALSPRQLRTSHVVRYCLRSCSEGEYPVGSTSDRRYP